MAVKRDIALNVLARMDEYRQGVAKMPGMTDEQAAKAAAKMQSRFASAASKQIRDQEKAAKKTEKVWSTVGKAIAAKLTADMVVGIGKALVQMTNDTANYRNEVKDLSDQTGVGVSNLMAMRRALAGSGKDFNVLDSILRPLPKRLDDFRRNTGEAKPAMEALGFSVNEAEGLLSDMDGTTAEMIRRLQGVDDKGRRAALATQLFGEQGAVLMQVLGDRSLDEWVESTRLGVDMSEQSIQKAQLWAQQTALLGDAWNRLKAELSDAFNVTGEGAQTTIALLFGLASGVTSLANDITSQFGRVFRLVSGDISFAEFRAEVEEAGNAITNAYDRAVEATSEYRFESMQLKGLVEGQAHSQAVLTTELRATSDELALMAKREKELDDAAERQVQAFLRFDALRKATLEDTLSEEEKLHEASIERMAAMVALREEGAITDAEMAEARKMNAERLHRDLRNLEFDTTKEMADELAKRMEAETKAFEQRLAQIERERKEREAMHFAIADSGVSLWNTMADAQLQSAERIAKVSKSQAREMAKNARSTAVFGIGLDTAVAVMKAFAMFGPPPSPAGIAAAAAAAAQGLVQMGAAKSTPLPKFFGGTPGIMGSGPLGPGEMQTTVHPGEAVLTSSAVDRLGAGMVAALNMGISQGFEGLGGGGPSVITLDGEVVGRAVASRARRGGDLRDAVGAGFAGFASAHGRN